jgi:hypothetical protein
MRNSLFALAALLASSSALADTLIANTNGIQVDANGKLERFTGILIGKDGKVKRLLHGEMLKLRDTDVVDAKGRTVLPGLVDAHIHITQLGQTTTQIALNDASSIEDLKARLAKFAADHPNQQWITGRGWNEENWAGKQIPTTADLDSVVPDRPVWLYRIDGHGAVANSAALREAGISRSTIDPQGGHIGRDQAGNPNGFLIDTARQMVEVRIPPISEAEQDSTILAAQEILLSDGITSVGNLRTSADDWNSLKRLGGSDQLKVRVAAFAHGVETLSTIGADRPSEWLFDDRLRLAGVKLYADGALGSRGAWLKKPYADAGETNGLSLHSDAELQRDAGEAARRGFQVAIHAIGDAANEQAIRILENLGKTYPGDRRWRIEHFQIVDPADISRLKPAGIIASMQPTHQTSDRLMAEDRLGTDRLAGAYAWQSVLKSGARIAFGSDAPFDSPNPFPGLSAAVSRQDLNGQPPGGWIPEERISFERALAGYTRDAAYAGFAERKVGSLDAGKWADFIIVDRHISAVDPQALGRTQVLETWISGKKVWTNPVSARAQRGR